MTNELTPDIGMAKAFLDSLYAGFPGEQIEFRLLKGKRGEHYPIRHLEPLPISDSAFERLVAFNRDGYNIYFGVATRNMDWQPIYIPAVWIDVDFKDLKPRLISPLALVILRLRSDSVWPSIIVESGHGLHAYWKITAGPDDHRRVKDINKRLAIRFGGDKVADVARILRLPGFYNVKDTANPQLCQVSDDVNWGILSVLELDELEAWLDDVAVPMLDEKLENLIKNGAPIGKRSEADFAVTIGMLRRGFSEDEVREAFQSGKIGDKAREKGIYEDDYLTRTLDAAQRRLREE